MTTAYNEPQHAGIPASASEKAGFQDLTPHVHPIQQENGAAENDQPHLNREYTQGGENDPDALRNLNEPGIHNIRGTTHIPGEEDQDAELRNKTTYVTQDEKPFLRPQDSVEYPGRDYAHVVSHSQYEGMSRPGGIYGREQAQEGSYQPSTTEQREAEQQRAMDAEEEGTTRGDGGYAGVGTSRFPHDQLQPSRSYIAESRPATLQERPGEDTFLPVQQQQQPLSQDYAQQPSHGVADNMARQPSYAGSRKSGKSQRTSDTRRAAQQPIGTQGSQFVEVLPAIAVGTGAGQNTGGLEQVPEDRPTHSYQDRANALAVLEGKPQQEEQPVRASSVRAGSTRSKKGLLGRSATSATAQTGRHSYIGGQDGPTTGVQPAAINGDIGGRYDAKAHPVGGGGLGAAIATSGHDLTGSDKKALKKEIKGEKKFEKSLVEEAKAEYREIENAIKQAKASLKKAEKSAAYEAGFRGQFEKAIKKEVKAKQRLLKVTNEYNKVAADLERANKEMEIRRNNHLADQQTSDADHLKLEQLRIRKGQNDMDREARRGEAMTKQAQAKRALSMSSKRTSLFSK